jgi:hypothetical protein
VYVPVEDDKVDFATLVLDLAKESGHPIQVVCDGGGPEANAPPAPGIDLLHVEAGGVRRVHVRLAGDVGLVEREEVLRDVGVHLALALVPVAPVLGTPELGNVFELLGHLGDGAHLPV